MAEKMKQNEKVKTQQTAGAAAETDIYAEERKLIGDKLKFDGVEAFNLLRTNLMFSFTDDKPCHVIGVTSPLPGTGKSLISTNLAYSIAKMNRKVLLIDGDMRLPTVAQKLGLKSKPGLSNLLVSACSTADVVQHFSDYMDVIAAGDIPPKPSELIGSDRMQEVLELFSKEYEYIIFDSTPVTVVPDTLVVAKYLDGIVLVVRKDHDEKNALSDTLRQLDIAKARILGFVFNNGLSYKSRYGKYYRYGKYKYGKYKYGKYKYGRYAYKQGYGNRYNTDYRYGVKPTLKETPTTKKEPSENVEGKKDHD